MVTFGSNDEGQCGHQNEYKEIESTTRVVDVWKCPEQKRIEKTFASDCASFVLLDDGTLWGWGTLMVIIFMKE